MGWEKKFDRVQEVIDLNKRYASDTGVSKRYRYQYIKPTCMYSLSLEACIRFGLLVLKG